MGGYGSGKKYWRRVKEKVEDCRSIDANNFSRWGFFKEGIRFSTLRWTRCERQTGACSIYVTINGHNDSIIFSYTYDGKPHRGVEIRLTSYAPGFGGRRYFFVCPHCGRRMRTLHFKYGEIACRICHNLTYESCVENNRFNSLYKHVATNLNTSWLDVKRHMNQLTREGGKEPKRPRGRPRKQTTARWI
jgi:hypothetical protein